VERFRKRYSKGDAKSKSEAATTAQQ